MSSTQEVSSPQQDPAVARQYDAWARVYDLIWRRYVNQTLPVLQRTADVGPGERVLDLASGTGELERRMVDATPDVEIVGVDLAPSMVERSRAKLEGVSGVQFRQADVHDLPFPDRSFDLVVCANTFHYFTDPHVVLDEAARVLRPTGRLVLLDWCRDYWTCRVMDAVLRWIDPAYQHCYTLEEMTALIESTALEVRRSFRYRFDGIWGMMVMDARPESRLGE
jgi:ubiquinone/menaquinone biosynthesis C-methylase UbiE